MSSLIVTSFNNYSGITTWTSIFLLEFNLFARRWTIYLEPDLIELNKLTWHLCGIYAVLICQVTFTNFRLFWFCIIILLVTSKCTHLSYGFLLGVKPYYQLVDVSITKRENFNPTGQKLPWIPPSFPRKFLSPYRFTMLRDWLTYQNLPTEHVFMWWVLGVLVEENELIFNTEGYLFLTKWLPRIQNAVVFKNNISS